MKTGGSSEQSTGDGWSERQGWVCYDGVALGSQRVACLQAPPSLGFWIPVSMILSEDWRLKEGGCSVKRRRPRDELCQKPSACEVHWRCGELERGHMLHFLSSY